MDLTEEYINMCNKATELQKLRGEELWENSDYYSCTTTRGPFISCWTDVEDAPYQMFKPYWLPRQDQLQEMIYFPQGKAKDWIWTLVDKIHKFAFTRHFKDWIPTSMEQLWLAFVMKENYGKTWNGQEWVGGK